MAINIMAWKMDGFRDEMNFKTRIQQRAYTVRTYSSGMLYVGVTVQAVIITFIVGVVQVCVV